MAGFSGARLLSLWRMLSPWPGGRWLFSVIVGRTAPYTGTIGARIVELRPGYAAPRCAIAGSCGITSSPCTRSRS
jgi:hypothetical protein